MIKRSFLIIAAVLLLGAGCAKAPTDNLAEESGKSEIVENDTEICVRTDGDTAGTIRLFAANLSSDNRDQWFTEKVVATGEAGDELCGQLALTAVAGDKLQINGDWNDGQRWLVENRAADSSGSDNIREIWIDDQYYSVGKECEYQSNGLKGFDVVCQIR